jgi:hypothetical protein
MTFPPSKAGDQYNYRVAAYLKSKGLTQLSSDYDLTQADIRVDPPQLKRTLSLLGTLVSFDIIASTARWEALVECKHSVHPTPVSIMDREFLESLAEFVAAEPYTESGIKEYMFLFISNSDTSQLSLSLRQLRVGKDSEVALLIPKLAKAAARRWKGANTKPIRVNTIRKCIDNLRVVSLEDGTINALKDQPEFSNQLNLMVGRIGEMPQGLPPNAHVWTEIALAYQGLRVPYLAGRWVGHVVSVPKRIIDSLNNLRRNQRNGLNEFGFEELPKGESLKVISSGSFSQSQVAAALTIVVNDMLQEISGSNFLVVISPTDRKIYSVDVGWFITHAMEYRDARYNFQLDKMRSDLGLPFGGDLLRLAIQESYRIGKGIHLDSALFGN